MSDGIEEESNTSWKYPDTQTCRTSADIENTLKKLTTDLETTENEISKKSRKRDNLKTDINDLRKRVNDINQIGEAYSIAYTNFSKDKEELDCFIGTIKDFLDNYEEKGGIDAIISRVEREINDQQHTVDGLEEKHGDAEDHFNEANRDVIVAQNNFDSKKTLQKEHEDTLKNIKILRDLTKKAKELNKPRNMYFWGTELDTKFKEFTLEEPDEFNAELYSAWCTLNEKKGKFRDNEEILKDAKSQLEDGKRVLELLRTNRDQNIIDKINNIGGQ